MTARAWDSLCSWGLCDTGTFLTDPVDVPWNLVDDLAAQLDVANSSAAKRHTNPSSNYSKKYRELSMQI